MTFGDESRKRFIAFAINRVRKSLSRIAFASDYSLSLLRQRLLLIARDIANRYRPSQIARDRKYESLLTYHF